MKHLEKTIIKLSLLCQTTTIVCRDGVVAIPIALIEDVNYTSQINQSTIGCKLLLQYFYFKRLHTTKELLKLLEVKGPIVCYTPLKRSSLPYYLEAYELACNWQCSEAQIMIKEKIIVSFEDIDENLLEIDKILKAATEFKVEFISWLMKRDVSEGILKELCSKLSNEEKGKLLDLYLG